MSGEKVCPTVPPPYRWDSGTSGIERDKPWGKPGTKSLKALAHAVLAVPLEWDKAGQDAGQPPKSCPTGDDSLGTKISEKLSAEEPVLGKPALGHRCILCLHWRNVPGQSWWTGVCVVSGKPAGYRSTCRLPDLAGWVLQ